MVDLDLDSHGAEHNVASAQDAVRQDTTVRAARDKAAMMRKSSQERRLPASVLAKRRAAEKLKNLLQVPELPTPTNVVVAEDNFDGKSEEEKAEFLAKQMSKLESSQILQILQSLETGALGKLQSVRIIFSTKAIEENHTKSGVDIKIIPVIIKH